MAETGKGPGPVERQRSRWRFPARLFNTAPNSLRIRYAAAMASIAMVDIAMNSVYFIVANRPEQIVVLVPESLLILGVLNVVVAFRIYRPIYRYISGGDEPLAAKEALAKLPRRSAAWVGMLTLKNSTKKRYRLPSKAE